MQRLHLETRSKIGMLSGLVSPPLFCGSAT
jgi:hypothetical protein